VITHAEFFPGEPEQIDNAAPQRLANSGGIVRLALKKSDHLQREPERLKGVLVLNKEDSYQLDVPVRTSAQRKRRKQ
jgi:hypothetical protein